MRLPLIAVPLLVLAASTQPVLAADDDVFDELVRDLEDEESSPSQPPSAEPEPQPAATAAASTPSALNPEISVVTDFALAWFSEDENLQTGAHDPTESGFNFQQLELSIRAPVDPYLRFDAFIVFGLFGVEVEEAYGTTLDLPGGFQARFGQFLTRFGRINATHPHSWDFADQPFALGRVFGAEANRGLGVELSALLPTPWFVEAVASLTTATGEASNRSFLAAAPRRVEGPQDLLAVTALKQFFNVTDAWSLLWGVSAAFGPNATGRNNRTEVYGSDLFLKFRPLTRGSFTQVRAQTEVFYRRRQVPEDVLWDVSGYSQVAVRFARRWESAARYEYGSTPFSMEGRPTMDALDPEWTDARHRLSASLSHYPTEFSRFRLQSAADLPGYRPEPIYSAFLTAELVVGAHGSHAF